jgi:glycosyltransferase involved in cell wall biosynthesis
MLGSKGIPATWGGIEVHVEQLAVRFAEMGHDVTVYCRPYYTTIPEETYKGVHLCKLPTVKSKNLDAISHTLLATLHSLWQDYDIVHYHAIGPAVMSFIPRIFGRTTIVTVHGLDWEREKWGKRAKAFLKFGEKAAVIFPDATIGVSKFLKSYLEEKYSRPVSYIPNAVADPVELAPNQIKSLGLEGKDYYLFVARLVPEKGAHFLLEAFKQLKTDKKLVIAGGSSHSDDYVNKLHQDAGDRVIFTGYVHGEMLYELYTNAYCYVHPSTIEGLPFTLLEAVSYGNCAIVSDIPPCLEVIDDAGIVFRSKDVADLLRALRQAEEGPELTRELGHKAKLVKAEYSYDSIAEKTIQLYSDLLTEKTGIRVEPHPA